MAADPQQLPNLTGSTPRLQIQSGGEDALLDAQRNTPVPEVCSPEHTVSESSGNWADTTGKGGRKGRRGRKKGSMLVFLCETLRMQAWIYVAAFSLKRDLWRGLLWVAHFVHFSGGLAFWNTCVP